MPEDGFKSFGFILPSFLKNISIGFYDGGPHGAQCAGKHSPVNINIRPDNQCFTVLLLFSNLNRRPVFYRSASVQ